MKRVALCVLTLVLILGLAVPAVAAESNYYYFDFRENAKLDTYFSTTGQFLCSVVVYYGNDSLEFEFLTTADLVYVDEYTVYCLVPCSFEFDGMLFDLTLVSQYSNSVYLNNSTYLISDGVKLTEPAGCTIELTRLEDKRTLMETIADTLGYLVQWSGMVISAVVDGVMSDLGMLFAIGIAVTALLFGMKFLFGFIWG